MTQPSRVSNEICIDGPIESVFDLVTTTRYWPRWHPATREVSGDTDRPLALGDRVHERAIIGGRAHQGTWTVVEHVRPTFVVLQIDDGRVQIAYTFGADGAATRLRRELTFRPQDFAGGTTDPAALEAGMHAQSDEALRQLKRLVEQLLPLERNKLVSRRILERIFNRRDVAALDDCFTPDASIHDPGEDFHGPAELRGGLENLFTALPDFRLTIDEQIAEGDRVVVRYRGQGTHRGECFGMSATGRPVDYTGVMLLRLEGERIADFWAQPDQLGLLKQMGMGLCLGEHRTPGRCA
jgi:predicted ester cyclase/uncharacterized protein YndB with AHSA1/START domain